MTETLVVVFLGPPGSGKGTQGKELAKSLGVVHMATGDLFRNEIANKSAIGREVETTISSGKLVSDELTYEVLKSQLSKTVAEKHPSCLVLDGYPRNGAQVQHLVKLIRENSSLKGPVFFELVVPKDVIVERISGRLVNPRSGAVYHLKIKPPKVPGRCDEDGGELIQRPDDKPEVVGGRFDLYQKGLVEMQLEIQKGAYPHYKFDGTGDVASLSKLLEAKLKGLLPGLTG